MANEDRLQEENKAEEDAIKAEKDTLSTDVSSLEEFAVMPKPMPRQPQGKQLSFAFRSALDQSKNGTEVSTAYCKEIEFRLKFLRSVHETALNRIEHKLVRVLWEFLVVNSLSEAERELFFT